MLLWVVRGAFVALAALVAAFAFAVGTRDFGSPVFGTLAGGVVAAAAAAVLIADVRQKEKRVANVSAVLFGLLFGLVFGWLVSLALDQLVGIVALLVNPPPVDGGAKVAAVLRATVMLIGAYVGVSLLVQVRDDFRVFIPFVEFTKQVKGGRPLVLDTSVIIDGRIADLCDTRIIDTRLVVPRFILQELQGIADSSDKLKRNRGRRGLDILKKMQGNPKIELHIHEGNAGELKPGEKMKVDERLVAFAKVIGGRVVTNDFNLNKMAQLQGVDVISLNEVANSLKTVALPGEYLMLKVVRAGDQMGQGVGYLEDGTMVVVEQGRNLIGQEVSIVVTSVLQNPAGRMIFGRPEQRQSGAYVPLGQSGAHTPVKPPEQNPPPNPPGERPA
ncbi:MAG: PIN domain-containing protein [Fimbriiglobus sp.]|jgi:uncharacterized protein YacL|nr:PIN domain-containing protein [Fimbriiglobus sp.]